MTERDKIKSSIQKSALELFSLNGYYQTSIAEITTNANISKGLFYHYYSSKESFFKKIIFEQIDLLMNYLPKKNEEDLNDDKIVYFINKVILPSLDDNKTHWKLLILLLSQQLLYETTFNYLMKSSVFIEYKKMLCIFFKEKGYENPSIEVELFTSSLMGICIQYITYSSEIPIKKILYQFARNTISKKAKTHEKLPKVQ